MWSVLGGIAASTSHIDVGVGVTCPIMRLHPAITAHAAATAFQLLGGRFFLGVGTGEALNEHILGDRWPRPEMRSKMLREAVEIMRELWTGETVDFRGEFYEVDNARLFDPPPRRLPVIVSGFGKKAVELAAQIGDGYWGHGTDATLVDQFVAAGGQGPRYAQLSMCWAEDAAQARKTVHTIWPTGGLTGQLMQDLPTWTHFEQAAELVDEERAVENTPCGPDVDAVVASVQKFVDAGFDHVYFHQIGPDQHGFFDFWQDELQPALADFAD